MIPLQLEITNFLSYRDTQAIDFTGIHLAGISGQNGAGKSSVLEAITWALFGQARTRSDDDIVNRSAANDGKRAEVKFTFLIDGQTYRVVRRKKKGGRLVLEFQVQRDQDDGEWFTLSETKARETQAKIEQVLGMNYDTFINVSFFLQGQADEFTTKTASQRKEILADLLGANRWDRFKEKAMEARKSAESQLDLGEHLINATDEELLEEDQRSASLKAQKADFEKVEAQLDAQTLLLNQLRNAAGQAEQKEKEQVELTQRIEKTEKAIAELRQLIGERNEKKTSLQSLVAQQAAIESDYNELLAAQSAFDAWQAKADQANQIKEAMNPSQMAIENARSRLQQQQQSLSEQKVRVEAMTGEQATLTEQLTLQKSEVVT